MDTIIIRTESNKTKALVQFLKAFDVKYELMQTNLTKKNAEDVYNRQFVNEILQSKADKKNGKGTKMTIEDVEKLWK